MPNELGIVIENNRPVVSSRKVTEVFEKEHNIVMRSIRELDCEDEFNECNFALISYKDTCMLGDAVELIEQLKAFEEKEF